MDNPQELVNQIDALLERLQAVVEVSAFAELSQPMEELERAMAKKAFADARFAWLAHLADAGRLVGSTRTVDYLTHALDIDHATATARLNAGRLLFDAPSPDPGPEPAEPSPDPAEAARREEEERKRREQAERDAAARAEARGRARRVRESKQRVIDQELERLSDTCDPSKAELHALALKEAGKRSEKDLRQWLRAKVQDANRRGRTPEDRRDRLTARKNRTVWLGQQDADGGVPFGGYLTAEMAAALRAALAPGRVGGSNTVVAPEEDKRTMRQRMADQFFAIIRGHLSAPERQARGIGSLVIATTLEDLRHVDADTRFETNTGYTLNALEVLLAGGAGSDFAVLMDGLTPVPLTMGRSTRTATLEQRLALAASELVCSGRGCDTPLVMSDIHHIVAFANGGRTDIENLTIACRPCHVTNNDKWDGSGGLGHFERDLRTGTVGWRPPDGGDLQFNETHKRSRAPGERLRARPKAPPKSTSSPAPPGSPEVPDPPPEDGGLFDLGIA